MITQASVKIPSSLSEWTVLSIQNVLNAGIKENQYFDFKLQLPHPKEDFKKHEFRKDLCAFANSYGGFIIIGVHEHKRMIVGVDDSLELVPQINEYQKSITPSIDFEFKTIVLPAGKTVYVLHIPSSRTGPHAIKRNDGLVFTKRLPGSNAEMTYEEVRSGFMLTNEKVSKLKLLLTQLAFLIIQAEKGIEESDNDDKVYPLVFDTTIFNLTVGEAYSLISERASIIGNLSTIAAMCGQINLKVSTYLISASTHGPVLKHNQFVRENCHRLKVRCEETIQLISALSFTKANTERLIFQS